jgi:hypothetical protein
MIDDTSACACLAGGGWIPGVSLGQLYPGWGCGLPRAGDRPDAFALLGQLAHHGLPKPAVCAEYHVKSF